MKLHRKAARRRMVRVTLLATNVVLLAGIVGFVVLNQHTGTTVSSNQGSATIIANPLDQLASADIALTVARLNNLPETTAINNQADSQATELAQAPSNNNVINKPQIVTTALKSKADIRSYKAVTGDTIGILATKFGVTSDSIRWSNGLTGEFITAGTNLTVPPVNGIVHTVRAGDTADSLATKYRASKDEIIAYNDAEISGLKVGEKIIVPGGTVAAPVVTRSVAAYGGSSFAFGSSAIYGSNGYDYGYCTWYVANKRIAEGRALPANLGDAWTWDDRARMAGIPVDNNPRAGDAIVVQSYRNPGHVAYVESVNSDGSVNISEMNVVSWNVRSTRTIGASEAHSYNYIH